MVRVRVRVRVRVAVCLAVAFSVWTEFTVSTGKKADAREECHWPQACKSFKRRSKGVKLNGILVCVNSCRETRTTLQPQPDGANPNKQNPWLKTQTPYTERKRVGVGPDGTAAAFSVWTELMVKVRVRVRVAACAAGAYSVWTQFTVPTGKRQ
jgi:hypothetical protein